jgi:CO/xanthine dehydrogenase Mo-binding subunit
MEPMNCTVHVRKDGCEVWVGSQAIARAQATAAKTTGFPLGQVVVHNHLIGGGFGRRLDVDGVTRAVQIAMHVEGPVKVVWTREEDLQHDMYRTIALRAPQSLRDGFLRRSTMVSTPTRQKVRSIWPMRFQTCMSSICGWNLRAFRLPSGAA